MGLKLFIIVCQFVILKFFMYTSPLPQKIQKDNFIAFRRHGYHVLVILAVSGGRPERTFFRRASRLRRRRRRRLPAAAFPRCRPPWWHRTWASWTHVASWGQTWARRRRKWRRRRRAARTKLGSTCSGRGSAGSSAWSRGGRNGGGKRRVIQRELRWNTEREETMIQGTREGLRNGMG